MNTTDKPIGRHPVNIGHLVMGLAFLGIVGVWAIVQTDTVNGDDIRWLMPIPWVFAGVVGLAVTAFTGSRRYTVRQTGWVGETSGVRQPGWVGAPSDQPDQSDQPAFPQTAEPHDDPEETP